ncbi:hypothetical protein AaE_014745 [Aphanomyces astaci]|uniref:Uncharacterized protein n=1 Tax=Aphanomyces astaci TaxID=112090 RepID=A0A6A4Z410_APHAT|nr:hypothetical protein AaE_014745 [Aphanomyces astaci]
MLSYVRPTHAPIHRTYGEKQDLLGAWNAVEGGGMTLVAFCRQNQLSLGRPRQQAHRPSNVHIATIIQDPSRPSTAAAACVDGHGTFPNQPATYVCQALQLLCQVVPSCRCKFETRRQANDAAASDDTVSGSEPNGVDTFDATETVEQGGGPSGEDTETDDELSIRDPALDRTYRTSKKAPCRPFRKSVVSEDADMFDNDDSLADSDLATLLEDSSHPFSCPFSPVRSVPRATLRPININGSLPCAVGSSKSHPLAASGEDSYDSDFEDYFKMTSVPVKLLKALGGKRSGKTPRTKCRPQDHTNPRDITPAPTPPSPVYPKDPATRRAATELSAEPTPVHPKDPGTRRAATPLSAAPTPVTRRGSNEASATRAFTNPKDPAISIKRGATIPLQRSSPPKRLGI